MLSVFPQCLLGTDAFVSCCIHPESEPYRWVWDRHAPNLHARGLVISAATVEQVYERGRSLALANRGQGLDEAKRQQNSVDKVVALFRQKGCILPITHELLTYAREELNFTIAYRRFDGTTVTLALLEKVVLATAIVGYRARPIWLMDYDQPEAFALLSRDYQLHVKFFARSHDRWMDRAS